MFLSVWLCCLCLVSICEILSLAKSAYVRAHRRATVTLLINHDYVLIGNVFQGKRNLDCLCNANGKMFYMLEVSFG